MGPLLWRVPTMAKEHLHHELVALGEEAFLLRWSTHFIKVANSTVYCPILGCAFLGGCVFRNDGTALRARAERASVNGFRYEYRGELMCWD